jgi:hypothetical protein
MFNAIANQTDADTWNAMLEHHLASLFVQRFEVFCST